MHWLQHALAREWTAALALIVLLLPPVSSSAEPVAVRFPDGALNGYLVLRSVDGTLLADGGLTQTVRGDRVTAKLVFRFKDGSVHEQTTVYSQRRQLRLISDHVVQKGPSFPQPMEVFVDAAAGDVTVNYRDARGEARTEKEHMELPADLANGLVGKLLINARPDAMPQSFSYVAATPKPRLVKLLVKQSGREQFLIGGSARTATHYALEVEIGGVAGVLAPLFGKQPPDSHVWIAREDVPAFVRAQQPLYAGGPLWSVELAGPVWPKNRPSADGPQVTASNATKR